jgi:hypothetical protein
MASSLFYRFFAPSLLAALLLSGCCADNECNCPDEPLADAIVLRFGTGFTDADLDTIVVQRYPLYVSNAPDPRKIIPETATLVRTGTHVRDSLVLNNTTPFSQQNGTKLNNYRYVVRYLRKVPLKPNKAQLAYIIDSVALEGSYQGDGCCTCYQNTRKQLAARPDSLTPRNTRALKPTPATIIK